MHVQGNVKRRWQGYQPYAPSALTPSIYPWYSFLLEIGSTPGPYFRRRDSITKVYRNALKLAGILRLIKLY